MKLKIFTFVAFAFAAQQVAAQMPIRPQQPYTLPELGVKNLSFSPQLRLDKPSALPLFLATSQVRNVYRYEDLAIFCRLEVKAERAAGFPVKFRLGEVNYVEQLEGKPYSIF